MDPAKLQPYAIALGLGLLVGLQRERVASPIAGIRTFPLLALLGVLCGQLGETYGGLVVAAGILGVAAMIVTANLLEARRGEPAPGITTEVAALLMFAAGVLLVAGSAMVAVAIAVVTAVLLEAKRPMHRLIDRIGDEDLRAILRFAVMSLVILPVLPNRDFGPYQVLNPFHTWLMVVLIVGINLSGYVAIRMLGQRAGGLLAGLLGGLVSSTATCAATARQMRRGAAAARVGALIIHVSSSVVLLRVLVEIFAVAPSHFGSMVAPFAALLAWLALISVFLVRSAGTADGGAAEPENPAEIRFALIFGALYAVILLAVAAAQDHFGARGLFGAAILAGLTDMDAITLSTARLVEQGRVEPELAWRVILVANASNLAFKTALVAALGTRALLVRTAFLLVLAGCGGTGLLVWLWPA